MSQNPEPSAPKELSQEDKLDLVRQRLLLDGTDKRVVSETINTRKALGAEGLGVFDKYEDGLKVADGLTGTCLHSRRALWFGYGRSRHHAEAYQARLWRTRLKLCDDQGSSLIVAANH